jgi:S-formylglutathione hydrolase FrmB
MMPPPLLRPRFASPFRRRLAASAMVILFAACSGSKGSAPTTTAEAGASSGSTEATATPPLTPPENVAALPTKDEPSPSRVVTETLKSAALGVDKQVVVYLPRGYDSQPDKRFPVFYYLHGLGGDETNWVRSGALDKTADQLGLEAIVVMPDGDDSFYVDSKLPIDYDKCLKSGAGLFMPGKQDPATTCVRTRNYSTYITKDLVGWVDATYRTIATREARAIAGLSMGGFGAMELGLRFPELFAAAASHSGAIGLLYEGPRPFAPGKTKLRTKVDTSTSGPIGPWLMGTFGKDLASWRQYDVVQLASALPPGKVALYFDCGTEDGFLLHDNVQYVHEALGQKNIPHEYFLGPGAHDFAFWRARLPSSLAFLRQHTAKPQ